MDSSTEEEDSGTDSSVEGQFDNNSHDNPIEVDSESEEEEEQDASVNTLLSRRPRNS